MCGQWAHKSGLISKGEMHKKPQEAPQMQKSSQKRDKRGFFWSEDKHYLSKGLGLRVQTFMCI